MTNERAKKSNESAKSKPITITLPASVIEEIDKRVDSDIQYSSRSAFLERAAKFLLDAKECPYCHTLNAGGQYCSSCRRDMTFTIEERRLAKQLYIEQHPQHRNTDDFIFFIHLDNNEIRRLLDNEEIPLSKNVTKHERKIFYESLKARIEQRKKEREARDKEEMDPEMKLGD